MLLANWSRSRTHSATWCILTSSMTNVQSLFSISWVRGSLNSVTVMEWLSGTGHLTWPTSGFIISGSQGDGTEATRRERLVHTTDRLDGLLKDVIKLYKDGIKKYIASSFLKTPKYTQNKWLICLFHVNLVATSHFISFCEKDRSHLCHEFYTNHIHVSRILRQCLLHE